VLFEDESSYWQDGTLHRTWAPVGQQPVVDTYGKRNTAHVYGAVEIAEEPRFHYQFADVFNGKTFHAFLVALVAAYDVVVGRPRKLFLIIDNGPAHNLSADGKVWLAANKHRIEWDRGVLEDHQAPDYSQRVLRHAARPRRGAHAHVRPIQG
jgi:hypothetical protein